MGTECQGPALIGHLLASEVSIRPTVPIIRFRIFFRQFPFGWIRPIRRTAKNWPGALETTAQNRGVEIRNLGRFRFPIPPPVPPCYGLRLRIRVPRPNSPAVSFAQPPERRAPHARPRSRNKQRTTRRDISRPVSSRRRQGQRQRRPRPRSAHRRTIPQAWHRRIQIQEKLNS